MNWWQAILLGVVQGLTEFLPVSSSGHLMIVKHLLGIDTDSFWDFTMLVHLATVLSTIVVFFPEILRLLKGFFRFEYNDETDYLFKIAISIIPVAVIGLFYKDELDALFSGSIYWVGGFLIVTACLLFLSDQISFRRAKRLVSKGSVSGEINSISNPRNGISYIQAFLVGVGQAFAVAPGVSRSGTTIAVGLITGVRRDVIAQFSFMMVLIPIIGEQFLDAIKTFGSGVPYGHGLSPLVLILAFISAFLSGLFACKAMVAIVRKSRLTWFAVYCFVVAILIFVLC